MRIVLDELFDLEYIDAYFNEDTDEIDRIEISAAEMGYSPCVTCTTVTNFCSQQVCCRELMLGSFGV